MNEATKPTQAQIEADLIFRLRQWRSNPFPETHLRDIFACMDEAAAALTAAAQVGDNEWEAVCDSYATENGQFHAEIERLRRENERLRLALKIHEDALEIRLNGIAGRRAGPSK